MNTPDRKEEFNAMEEAWREYPSQDNEGFTPDRGGFKVGWFAALRWYKARVRKKYEAEINHLKDLIQGQTLLLHNAQKKLAEIEQRKKDFEV